MPPKAAIPKALREQVWVQYNGRIFDAKCNILWCTNRISPFQYHVGHNQPESKGGTLAIENLRPICPNCNLSMGNHYTIDEWNALALPKEPPAVAAPANKKKLCCLIM
jgi:5-methylcytosine-specific restriction endonuclease McrA